MQPCRPGSSRKYERWLRQLPPPPGLLGAVSIKQKRAYHPDTISRTEGCDQTLDSTFRHTAVGVEQKYIFRSRPHKSEVAGGREA